MTDGRDESIVVDGIRLHYIERGEVGVQPMVLVHGLEDSARTWDPFAASMSHRYRVIALDHRGHGESEWAPRGRYRAEHYVSDLQGVIDQRRLGRTVLIGHAEGARHALRYAVQFPEGVASLVLVDGDMSSTRPARKEQLSSGDVNESEVAFDSLAALIARLRSMQPNSTDEALEAHAESLTRELSGGKRAWKRDPAAPLAYEWADMWPDLSRPRSATLVLRGRQSAVLGHEPAVRMQEELRRPRLAELEGAGHWVHREIPGAFETTVRWFLENPPT